MCTKSKLMRQLLLTIAASAVLLASCIRADEGNYTCSCRCCCYGECSGSNETVKECIECLQCDGVQFLTGDFTSELTTSTAITTVGSNYTTTRHSSDQSTHSSSSICMDKCLNSSREPQCNGPQENLDWVLIVSLSILGGALIAGVLILAVAFVHHYGCRCRRCWRRKSNLPMLPSSSFVDMRLSDCSTPSMTQTSDEKCRAGLDDPTTNNNNGSSNAGFSNGRQLPPVCRTRDEDTDVDLQKRKVSRGSVESEAGTLSGANLHFKNGKYEVKKVFEQKSDTACSPPVGNKEAKTSVSSTKTIGGNDSNSAAAGETGRPSNSITSKVAMLPPSVSRPSLSKPHEIPPVGASTTSKPSGCPTAGKKLPAPEKPKPSKSKGENSDSSSGSSSSLEYAYAELPEEVLARQEAFIKSMLKASNSPKLKPTVPRVSPRVSPKKEPKLYVNVKI